MLKTQYNSITHLYHTGLYLGPLLLTWINFNPGMGMYTTYFHDNVWESINNFITYRQVSNIRRTKSQHLKDYRNVLRLSLPNPLKPDVKSRMKM